MVDDISQEGLRTLLREQGVSFPGRRDLEDQHRPGLEVKRNRVLELYAIADGHRRPDPDDPTVVLCCDEFGPLDLQFRPGKQWAATARQGRAAAAAAAPAPAPAPAPAGDLHRPHGVRHLFAALDPARDRLHGHVTRRKSRTRFPAFCR